MSGNSTSTPDLSKFNFPGGFPASMDLAPSIVFLIAYLVTVPLFVWRIVKRESRSKILIRPGVFLAVQLGGLGLRAYMSKAHYGEGELIAELVLISVGVLFLVDPILSLWERLVREAVPADEMPRWVKTLTRVLRLGLLAAIITTIVGSSMISNAISDPSKISQVVHLRKISSGLTLGVIVVALLAVGSTTVSLGLNPRRAGLLFAIGIPLLVVAAYRMAQIAITNADSAVRDAWAFWILQMLFEFITYVVIISFPINTFFPDASADELSKVQMSQA